MNWDDIKIFLEVARAERLSTAAKRLTMDASTVSRRLHKLEESIATKLFDRTQDGHVLTPDGEMLLTSACKMEQDAQHALSSIHNNNEENCGLVRIGVTEALGNFFVSPNLLTLQQQHPSIDVHLLLFSRYVKISRNEADIAIAVERPKSTSMIVSKLCDYKLQLYVHQDYLDHNLKQYPQGITLDNLAEHKWVTYVDNLIFTDQLSYIKELDRYLSGELKANFSSTSIISQYFAIKSGLGIGILPCFLADQDKSLIKLHSQDITISRSFWLVTHPESKRLSHVNTVWQYLKQLVLEHAELLNPKE
ncbi:LysR family transcriptional regulator [Colwellia psychrerythraea]|uniref:Transcriptional regulator, LysR family n=1 Tax=Colwellia psychrerythraea (strain 34H / ATCC BAA-681) TaxID=167879 RepID=Q47YM4_COLP3|nr:LysR family transcriptional regulator [Colwellia psychrerythraea]AAZ27849.1 transcriptional regulator, LysR family [Colwellia psychrerythraea 34H]